MDKYTIAARWIDASRSMRDAVAGWFAITTRLPECGCGIYTMRNERLFCSICGNREACTSWRCGSCGGPLAWNAPASFTRHDIDTSANFIWRYAATLPKVEPRITFGEGQSPLTTLTLSNGQLAAKLEMVHPTSSFKDRGCALLVNAFANKDVMRLVEDSSGNAAASLAGYAARAGTPCTIFAPARASTGKLIQAAAYGAEVVRVEGNRADVAAAAEQRHDPANGVIYASHNWHPWFIAGVATWAFEVWEQRGFTAPEAIVVPAGSGSLILGAWSAFRMLAEGGEIERMPRLFAAQPAACAPLAHAIDAGLEAPERFAQQSTLAEGASIALPVRGAQLVAAIRESRGSAVTISEEEIASATVASARQGLFIEPTSALAVAAAERLVCDGAVPGSEDTVVVLTGSGLKAQSTIEGLLSLDNPSASLL